jgi:stearoyl-CoA desaturase (delta-9 desaturase)
MIIFIFLATPWYLSLFSQTFFLHRYAAHKMFTMSNFWEKYFYIFAYITQGSSYMSPYAYGAMHRLHHAYADTENDPHSPSYDANPFAMMWRSKNVYLDIYWKRIDLEDRFVKDLPKWHWFDSWGNNWISRILWGLSYIAFYVMFAEHWWMYLFLPAHFIMGPLHGVIINWIAHKYGYRNFEVQDTAHNIMPLDVFMMGEGYHNNHHANGSRANFGFKWHEIDPTFVVMKVLNAFRIIRIVPEKITKNPERQPETVAS